MRAHPAHPGCDKHGEGLSGDGVVYVEGKALTVGAHQYCPRVYRGQGVPVGLEIHARVSRHSRHEHEHIRPSGACSIARKMFARGRDDYSAITTILHAIYPWPPLLWRLRGVCVEGYGWIKAPGRGGGGIWCRYFRTVPEDKETTRHWGLRRWLGECCCPSSPWCLRPRTTRPLCLRSATRRRRANRHLPSRHRMVRRPRRVRAAAAAAAAPNGK